MTYRDPSDEYDECPRCGDVYVVTRASDDICPECRDVVDECGWCGEPRCTDDECAEEEAEMQRLREARTPVCLVCSVAMGGTYSSSTYRAAKGGEACAHPDHGRAEVSRW